MNKYKPSKERQEELEQLQLLLKQYWPEFEYKIQYGKVYVYMNVGYYAFSKFPDIAIRQNLDIEYNKTTAKKEFQKKYPFLLPMFTDEGRLRALWVNRPDVCGTAITDKQELMTDENLVLWNAEAEKSLQKGYFFCTHHKVAHPKSEFGYSHFVGVYCNEYKESHPREYEAARRETYN